MLKLLLPVLVLTTLLLGLALRPVQAQDQGQEQAQEQTQAQAQAASQAAPETCEGLTPRACRNTAIQVQFGLGVAQDLVSALRLLTDACGLGDTVSCTEVGVAHQMGIGTPLDQESADRFYALGCTSELVESCTAHGLSYLHPESPINNAFKASTILNRVCWQGSADGCFVSGRLNQTGETGKPAYMGVPDALRYYREACRLGRVDTCLQAAQLIGQRPALALYAHTARDMLDLGCNLHMAELACVRLVTETEPRAETGAVTGAESN